MSNISCQNALLLTLGIAIDEYGFLLRSKILPENVSEPSSLQGAISFLIDPEQLFRPTILMDLGITTKANLQWLRENKFFYIISAKQDAPLPHTDKELERVSESGVKVSSFC